MTTEEAVASVKLQMEEDRSAHFKASPQLSLGELIDKLKECVAEQKDGYQQHVVFDFGSEVPTDVSSWRGIYAELAIEYASASRKAEGNLKEFINILERAVGATFEGYKGGEFVMSRNTPVWVDNYGESNNTAVVGVLNKGYYAVILTQYCEAYER